MLIRRVIIAVMAATTIFTGITVPPAHAATGSTTVVLGDSFIAIPTNNQSQQRPCGQSAHNPARQIGARDWSCSTYRTDQVLQRAHDAIRAGDLHRGTTAVVINAGGNDWLQGRGWAVDHNMTQLIALIRQTAPNARISLTSNLPLAPGGQLCITNPGPALPLAPITWTEDIIKTQQKNNAQRLGVKFIDIGKQAQNHGTCSRDPYTAIAAAPGFMYPAHPTQAGANFIAQVLREQA